MNKGVGAAAEVAGGDHLAFLQPALGDQIAGQQADRRFGQTDGAGQIGARQPGLRAQLAHQTHAIAFLQQLLAAGGFSVQRELSLLGLDFSSAIERTKAVETLCRKSRAATRLAAHPHGTAAGVTFRRFARSTDPSRPGAGDRAALPLTIPSA
jgi:hypothetical protein